MSRTRWPLVLTLLLFVAGSARAGSSASVDGYVEFKKGNYIIVDGQRVEYSAKTKMRGEKMKSAADIPLGYRAKVKGKRAADGTLVASQIESSKNGSEFMESQILDGTNQAEKAYVSARRVSSTGSDGKERSIGALTDKGPEVDRCRRIVDRLLPSYVDPKKVRVYVVDNKEWNAMAMANFSIYTFSGLMKDLDDDELAIVLGHEIAHATYEHSRKQARGSFTSGILGQAAAVGSEFIKNDLGKAAAQQATALGQTMGGNMYSREHEDQADRVGLRYVYEAGYDYRKAPKLWMRFAEKYGDGNKFENFFFGDHSLSVERAKALQQEIDRNYADPAKDPPTRTTASAKG